MQKLLLVEDSIEIQTLVKKALALPDLVVMIASTISQATDLLAENGFQLILLDIQLPDGDGLEFCSRLQGQNQTREIPVIFLTGREEISTKLAAFSLGAEDYIVKPFNPLEFRARIQAKLKKIQDKKSTDNTLTHGPLTLNLPVMKAYVIEAAQSRDLELTPLEFKLLFHLASSLDQVYSREQILSTVWGQGVHVFDRTVDTHIAGLRKKMGAHAPHVEAVPGIGYRFTLNPRKKSKAA